MAEGFLRPAHAAPCEAHCQARCRVQEAGLQGHASRCNGQGHVVPPPAGAVCALQPCHCARHTFQCKCQRCDPNDNVLQPWCRAVMRTLFQTAHVSLPLIVELHALLGTAAQMTTCMAMALRCMTTHSSTPCKRTCHLRSTTRMQRLRGDYKAVALALQHL